MKPKQKTKKKLTIERIIKTYMKNGDIFQRLEAKKRLETLKGAK